MSSNPHNAMNSGSDADSGPDSGEDTLRLIAGLPAPAGLEERVREALRAAPHELRSRGRVLAWPARFSAKTALESNWMRAAAAAAIVFVVVGGGWGVYRRVQPGPAGKVIVMPQPVPSSGGLSGAGAIRKPETIPGPKLKEQKSGEQGSEGTSHPSGHESPAGDRGREPGTPPTKKPAAPEKTATGQHPASAPTPQPAVSQ